MNKPERKDYFDFIFSISITVFTALSIVGQITFLTIGLTVGIADWGTDGVLAIGFVAFGLAITIGLLLTLFAAWKYWSFDSNGVINGNLFWKRRILFSEMDFVEVKVIVIGALPFIASQENICFYKGKTVVTIPTYCLSAEEMEWIKQQAGSQTR